MKVPFVNLGLQYAPLRVQILAKFDEISSHGSYVLGADVKEFEENFARYCGTRYAIGVGNGGDALFLSLLALGIGAGDEVITAPNSFVATAWAIANTGAKPVFVDVRDDYNIDPDKIQEAITSRTKALIPVHLTGRVAEMDAINTVAKKNGLWVVEDAAQAVGAEYKQQKAGSLGTLGCFSLHPLKNLHVHGDGGVITTNESDLYHKLINMRNHGLRNRDECEFWGVNSRLDSIQAAIANLKLPYLDLWNERFRSIAQRYTTELKNLVTVPQDQAWEKAIYHRYIVCHPQRDRLQKKLSEYGVETKVNYPIPLHLQDAAKPLGYQAGDFPVTERLAQTILSLPIYAELTDEQVEFVIASTKECLAALQ